MNKYYAFLLITFVYLVPSLVQAASTVPMDILNVRAQMEIHFTMHGSYTNACTEKTVKSVLKKHGYTCLARATEYVLYQTAGRKKVPCADYTGYHGIVERSPKVTKEAACGAKPAWMRTIQEKLDTPVIKRHDWSKDLNHKYYQQVFWELRGESYSWKHDINKGSYLGLCRHKALGKPYLDMMKRDGLKDIECGDSRTWFYIKATMPNGWQFCLNRNDQNNNDSKQDMENCQQTVTGKFTNVVKVK